MPSVITGRDPGGRMKREPQPDLEGASLPPLDVEVQANQLSERRMINARWFAAIVLMAGAAVTLLLAAIHVALGPRARFSRVDAVLRREATGGARRAGRLTSEGYEDGTPILRSRVEQIDDTGRLEAFGHIIVNLGELQERPVTADRESGNSRGAILQAQSLPPEIIFGSSRPQSPPQNMSAYADDDEDFQTPTTTPLGAPINLTVIPKVRVSDSPNQHVVVAKPGDNLDEILAAVGAGTRDTQAITALMSRTSSEPETFDGGEKITILKNDTPINPRILRISIERPGRPKFMAALADDGRYVRVAAPNAGEDQNHANAKADFGGRRPSSAQSLGESLEALAGSGVVDHSLIDMATRLYAHNTDLQASTSARDSAELLYRLSNPRQPELIFAALTLNDRKYRYYQFSAADDGSTDYYDRDGHSVTEPLLRRPVADSRLGDGFGWRIHPILGVRLFHKGVDYDAPFGSPVVAAGAGVIETIDQEWGYGRYVRIRHDLGYETTYAHLSGIAPGLHVGERVRQGETIAYVGSTGLSTGPHLYYEVSINGHRVDPRQIYLGSGRILAGRVLDEFEKLRDRIDLLCRASGPHG
jgi:murein DD-endopeptidase MepM/ murein hydrolase activator NlpD